MLTLRIEALKAMSAHELQVTLDSAISAMLFPYDDPTYDGGWKLQIIGNDPPEMLAGEVVALRYLWFLYKKATIPGYEGGHSPAWFNQPDSQGSSAAAGK